MRAHCGTRDAMRPYHLLDVGPDGVVDLLGDWDWTSGGLGAHLVATPWGERHLAMRTAFGTESFLADSATSFNDFGTSDFAIAILMKVYSTGNGNWSVGNKDENATSGAGWAISTNADGGVGLAIGGPGGYVDQDTDGTVNLTGNTWRWFFLGYRNDVQYGVMAWGNDITGPTPRDLVSELATPGDVTSDAKAGLHGLVPTAADANVEVARLIAWKGTAATNVQANVFLQPTIGGMNSALVIAPAGLTAAEARNDMRAEVQGLTPATDARQRYTPYREDAGPIRRFAEANPDAAYRLFSIRDVGRVDGPAVNDRSQSWHSTEFEVVCAYPRDRRYGPGADLDAEEVLWADLNQLDDAIGTAGNATDATVTTVDKTAEEGEACRFAVLRLRVEYWRTVA